MTFDFIAIGFLLVAGATGVNNSASRLCEPWNMEYTGKDAVEAHVIGLWQFKPGAENLDSSPNGRDLDLKGATISSNGWSGSCLESYRGWPEEDVRHAAIVSDDPDLSPDGAFSIEMWIKPKPELEGYPDSFLIDKKYVSHDDYQIILTGSDKNGFRRLRASLGFGDDSETYHSEQGIFETGVWYHIAFVYDGAGKVEFFLNGSYFGGTEHPGRESVSSGKHYLSIGDRIGSYYHGFPGYIDQVRICKGALEFRRANFDHVSDRTVFVRMEKAPAVELAVTNFQRVAISGAVLRVSLDGSDEKEFALPEIAAGAEHIVQYILDTSIRHGEYRLKGRLEIPGDKPYSTDLSFPVQIVPRPLPYRMPVLMWGVYSSDRVMEEMDRLKQIGFTHVLGLGADFARIWEAGKSVESEKPDRIAERKRMLDEALANDISICASLSPGRWAIAKEELLRVDREGEVNEKRRNICCLFPRLRPFCYDVGASVVKTYGHFPAFDSALLHTEVRDGAQPCFHEHDRAAFKEYSGFDIPDAAVAKQGVKYQEIENFPESRVIPDDYPLYVYYQWYWKHGDGWNALNTSLNDGLKSTGRKLWTFHDPAVRVASVYGSGGAVDVLSQWTYSYPDPIRIGTATDELLAMAAGAENSQQVMKMTQIIWYRSQTAPMSEESERKVAAQSVWEDTDPDAAFITIHPMQLREAFWTKIARPIKGIMYHGWPSLVAVDGSTSSYRYTHPQTQHELTRLTKEVVKPIGPTLVQVPGVRSDVAFLESFSSQVFAGRGTYGWGASWVGDAYITIQYAQLHPDIVFDETIVDSGLDGYRVLVMMDCDVLTQSVADRVKEFQNNGGIVIGDDRLCPAIKPDIVVEPYSRARDASESRSELQKRAVKLREELEKHYTSYVESSNTDVITYRRRYGSTDYVFAINDLREFGDYVGHHRRIMENGLPSDTGLTIQRAGGFVYDLVHGYEVDTAQTGGNMHIETNLEPCGGKLFMVTERAIDAVTVDLPEMAAVGESISCKVSVTDKDGKPLDAVVPIKVDILDPDGRPSEFSGFYGAADGVLEINLDVAPNDVKGTWEVRVKELASGKTAIRYFRVK